MKSYLHFSQSSLALSRLSDLLDFLGNTWHLISDVSVSSLPLPLNIEAAFAEEEALLPSAAGF